MHSISPANQRVAVISDNFFLATALYRIVKERKLDEEFEFSFFSSPISPLQNVILPFPVEKISLKEESDRLVGEFTIIISAHCKQIFPRELVQAARCANIHPGLNPHNRGWYPQVFSIINKKPWGATFHLIDEQLDHGAIIAQVEMPLHPWDTSLSAYSRVQNAEVALLEKHLEDFLHDTHKVTQCGSEGNINLRRDFKNLCELNLGSVAPLGEHIDLLRALSHGDYRNAFFIDSESGKKIYISIKMEIDHP
jgi:methionyl-tRNA formyltransferase